MLPRSVIKKPNTNNNMSETMRALEAGLSIEGITMYLFWVGIVAMGAGAVFFFDRVIRLLSCLSIGLG